MRDERLHVVVAVDFVDGDRNFLPAAARESHVHVAFQVERGIGDRVQIVGDRLGDSDFATIAYIAVAFDDHVPGLRTVRHACDYKIVRADHNGAAHPGKADLRPRQVWRLESAADDLHFASGQRCRGFDGLNVGIAVEVLAAEGRFGDAHGGGDSSRHKIKVGLQQGQRVEPCSYIVHHDAGSLGELFQTPQGKRFHDVEYTKEYKTGQQVFPMQRNTY